MKIKSGPFDLILKKKIAYNFVTNSYQLQDEAALTAILSNIFCLYSLKLTRLSLSK